MIVFSSMLMLPMTFGALHGIIRKMYRIFFNMKNLNFSYCMHIIFLLIIGMDIYGLDIFKEIDNVQINSNRSGIVTQTTKLINGVYLTYIKIEYSNPGIFRYVRIFFPNCPNNKTFHINISIPGTVIQPINKITLPLISRYPDLNGCSISLFMNKVYQSNLQFSNDKSTLENFYINFFYNRFIYKSYQTDNIYPLDPIL